MILQALLAILFVGVLGCFEKDDGFEIMVVSSAPYFWGYLALTVSTLIVLRFKVSAEERTGYQVPLFPLPPILFVIACLFMAYQSFDYMISKKLGGWAACIGGWTLLGIVLSLLMKPGKSKNQSSSRE